VIVFSQDADADRAFLRDVLCLPHVDAGDGWLIFALPPAELAVHPAPKSTGHQLHLMSEDLPAAVRALSDRGVEFTQPVTEQRWGTITAFRLPGGSELCLYQPRHPLARQAPERR
jgi:catechol 2,3-dioxygenase-like lactoylglutathione lyase family enzyme